MRLIAGLCVLSLLAGCSSWQADPESIKAVPPERLLGYQQPLENAGEISIIRDFGGMGAGCYIAVLVDRRVAARVAMAEQARFYVPPGTRVLGIGIDQEDDTLCGKGRLNRELAVTITAGEHKRFRILTDNRQGFHMKAVEGLRPAGDSAEGFSQSRRP